jgi:hypothetical protein
LVSKILYINSKIIVPQSSTILFAAAGDIHVGKNVGENYQTPDPDLEGFYSAGGSFIVDGNTADGKSCPGAPDKRLNMQGSIITNGGSFTINRDMCAGDVCPTFSIQSRPDFVITAPAGYLHTNIIQQELAP